MPVLCWDQLGPKRNLDHRSFFCLDCLLMRSSKLLLFSKDVRFNSGVRLLLELYCVFVIEHVVFFTIWAKLTVAFTCTFEPLISLLLSEVVVVSDLNKHFGGSTDLARKRHGSTDLHTPIHPSLTGSHRSGVLLPSRPLL